jgi:hypothetical protein
VLQACWRTFDAAVQAATGKALSKGPRGGGRDLEKIIQHVRDVDASYLASLGGKLKLSDEDEPQALAHIRRAILTTLIAAARGEVPARGPRGGVRWTPRYFVRRLAWHELDHAWRSRTGPGDESRWATDPTNARTWRPSTNALKIQIGRRNDRRVTDIAAAARRLTSAGPGASVRAQPVKK